MQQLKTSGFRRGAKTFTTWLTRPSEHDQRTKLGHRIHAMMKRGVASIDHRMHVMVGRGVAIIDHRMHVLVGRRVAIIDRGADGDTVSQRRSAVCFTARVGNAAVQYTSRHAVCFTARAYSTTVQCLSTGCERIDTVSGACTNMHMYTVFSTPHGCISHDCTTAYESRRATQLLCTVHSHCTPCTVTVYCTQ